MKKLLYIFFMTCLGFGCEDQFLEERAVTVLNGNYYKTAEGLRSLVNGSYQVFRFKPDYLPGLNLFGVANDCEVFLHNNNDRIALGTYTSGAWGGASSSWTTMRGMVEQILGEESGGVTEGMYPVINRCNTFLDNYEMGSDELREQVKDALGEILFIRAYSYYLLTNVLGDVPLILTSPKEYTTVFDFPKAPLEEIYQVMITDLRTAVEVLPEEATQLGRVSKPAAAHLLAKLYLHRAQAADWANAEEHLAMLYKGKVATDLDSAIYYSSMVIDQKSGETAFGGLAPNFADLWQVAPNDPNNLSQNYARDLVSEVILSSQYEGSGNFNGRYGGSTLIHFYNQDYTVLNCGLDRANMTYPRPYRAAGPNDWAYDMFTDKANDSRFAKTYLTEYASNNGSFARNSDVKWDKKSAYYYNNYLKDRYTERYEGADVVAGESKIEFEKRCLVFIENSKDEPLDSLWVASQPYLLLARWVAGSPDGEGYYDYDGDGNIIGLKPGVTVDPDNPVVADVSNREVRYRIIPESGPSIGRYGCDAESSSSLAYLSPAKWIDRNRGQAVNDRGQGAIDIPVIRLAETYLIRAEALGRRDGPAAAISDLNVIRQRAAYHVGENRSDIIAAMEPGVLTGRYSIPADEQEAPYTVNQDSYDEIMITGEEWGTGTKAQRENYPPTASTEMERFIHFIYNEKAREFIFEQMITEDLHNAGILYDRVYYRDYFGAPIASQGTSTHPFPVDVVDQGGVVGAIGTGRGQLQKFHTFKPWPISFLNLLTDSNGAPLDQQALDAYQNPGY
ncbi:SusD-like starch-binding protein associating with outer membrane [Marinoscillum furvescens DSM 4134]|uniref:SusD-like starch-binding protein associating with outer membrane n=2 Tax=Marinoscillum furvescens TaxID=1026 RepID=A0A3D9LFR1_MARFU|nr:SusD-like starch-binding protein associating with outer membrane [Marinoscillum furvescens DSM 4134]